MSKKVKVLLSRFDYNVTRRFRINDPSYKGTKNVACFLFDKMTDYNLFVTSLLERTSNQNVKRLRDSSLINRRPEEDFHGTRDAKELKGIKEKFRSLDFIKQQVELFRTSKINDKILSFDNKKNLRFNDRDLGIFSFDLASAGIHKVKEYYSNLLKLIVDPNEVETVKEGDKFKYFYTGTPYHEVEQRDKLLENGLPKLRTSVKKVFIDIPKPKKSLPQIDIFVSVAYSWMILPDEIRWNALCLIAIAEKLNATNISTRIWLVAGNEYSTNKADYSIIKIKDFNEPLDINSLGILVADSRFYRFDLFKGFISLADFIGDGDLVDGGLGIPITFPDTIKQDVLNTLYDQEMFDLPDEKILYEETKLFLTGVHTETDAKAEFTRVMDYLERIAEKFTSPDKLTKFKPTDYTPTPTFLPKEKIVYDALEQNEFRMFTS